MIFLAVSISRGIYQHQHKYHAVMRLLVDLEVPNSTWLEREVSRLQPHSDRKVTKKQVVNAALAALSVTDASARDKIILLRDMAPVGAPRKAPLEVSEHRLYTNAEVAEILGVGESMVTLVKRQKGITRKKVFLSEIRDFLLENPNWNTADAPAPRRATAH